MQGKTVLFNLWGGVLIPRPLQIFNKYEDSYGLPRDFVYKAIDPGDSEGALQRAQKGKLMFTQMLSEMEMELQRAASSQGLSLPPQFSVRELFGKVREDAVLNKPMLDMATKLRRNGLVTCVLANNWVDDSAQRKVSARILSALHGYFDLVIQSCHVGARVPEPAMFNLAMQLLNCKPNQAIYLDVVKENLTAAEDFGMTAVSVEDQTEAMNQLQLLSLGETFPVCCVPEDVSHGFVTIKPGVETHYVEMGDGPPVLLCHGFPESWYSWRYQIPALADAGFRVLAPDMKGYGNSTAPSDIEEYSQEQLCQGLVTFLDKLGIPQVTLVGHDWGGSLVWNMAQCYPERVRAVASLNTPLFPVDPNTNPMEKLKAMPVFEYQIYFQEPGVAEAELEKDLMRTFKLFFSRNEKTGLRLSGVCKRGGLFVGMPEDVPRSSFLTESALDYYVQQYKKTGFGAPLNWYRNIERNWKWICSRPRGKLMMPALMVTAGKDPVLLPVFSTGMENMIPNLTRGHIEDCGHWTQVERPTEVNNILISWLKDIHQKASTPTPKL